MSRRLTSGTSIHKTCCIKRRVASKDVLHHKTCCIARISLPDLQELDATHAISRDATYAISRDATYVICLEATYARSRGMLRICYAYRLEASMPIDLKLACRAQEDGKKQEATKRTSMQLPLPTCLYLQPTRLYLQPTRLYSHTILPQS